MWVTSLHLLRRAYAEGWGLPPAQLAVLKLAFKAASGNLGKESLSLAQQQDFFGCLNRSVTKDALQAMHVPCASSGCTVPILHSMEWVEPVGQKKPIGQSTHWAALPSPVAPLYVPSPHGSAALAPSGQYAPSGQTTHASSAELP